jgi:hypothetical protein
MLEIIVCNWCSDSGSSVGNFPEPVQTFDYGHGASSRRADIPNTGMASLLQDIIVYIPVIYRKP